MTAGQLRKALDVFGLSQAAFARLIGVERSTVRRWCNPHTIGGLEVPRYVERLLQAWTPLTPTQRRELWQHPR